MPSLISANELLALQLTPRDHALLDVRERYEYDSQHIPGSLSLPRGVLEFAIDRTCPSRHATLVAYCDDGKRSALAAETLHSLHYEDVRVLSGGLRSWTERNLPVLKGNSLTAKIYAEKLAVRDKVKFTDPVELARTLKARESLVLDTRTKAEYGAGHIPGAYWGGSNMVEYALSAVDGQDKQLVVYCAGRTRGILGAYVLSQHFGIEQVSALRNGTMAWQMAGFSLESGASPGRLELNAVGTKRTRDIARDMRERQGLASIGAHALADFLSRGVPCYVFDVRLAHEYIERHIRGSISCEAGQMALRADDLVAMPGLPVILYCDSQIKSTIAGVLLKQMGYRDVRLLEGGLAAWGECGFEFEQGQPNSIPSQLIDAASDIRSVFAEELQLSLRDDSGVTALDVRSAGEFAPGHIDGSIWIPRGRLECWAENLLGKPSEQKRFVTLCDNGQRSLLAALTLRGMGYPNVCFLKGGLNAWRANGMDVQAGWASKQEALTTIKVEIPLARRVGELARTRDEMLAYLKSELDLVRGDHAVKESTPVPAPSR